MCRINSKNKKTCNGQKESSSGLTSNKMASKRRRRLKLNLSSLFALVLVNLLIAGSASHHHHHHNYHHHHHHYQQHPHSDQLTVLSPSSQQQAALQVSPMHLCSQLPSQVSKHMKLCKLIGHSPSADEAVAVGTAKGLAECKSQFKSERWNCSHSMGDQHLLTSELALTVGSREGAFVQAIAAAGIVHSIATACSVGSLSDCACDKSRIGLIGRQDENWKWGGCSNNIRHGMLFAKNLVELSDAVHQQQLRHQQQRHWLKKRALTSRHREPNQVRSRDLSTMQEAGTFVGGLQQTTTTNSNSQLCQRNHNITQATHLQLIKSLMAKNSLQRHQEIRLAMNMHNNKVGRMAVAKNMVLMCRCHGLSGSCSLKTCWLILPDFQVIGSYLKRKYESSIHLAKAINVNKLIPMMDRGEVSSILVGGSASPSSTPPSQQPVTPVVTTTTTASTTAAPETEPPVNEPALMPEYAALVAPQMSSKRGLMNGHLMMPPSQPARTLFSANLTSLQHYNYYERHKQLQQVVAQSTTSSPSISIYDQTIPVNLSPMTQQQYQLLLRELKLCNINNSSSDLHTSYLQTRDLGSELHAGKSTSRQSNKLLHHQNGQLLKAANQQLSQLLHSNKDDLIHLHRSPDYCEADASQGFAGTQARVCSADPWAPDNCDKLCCGRGYTVIVQQHPEKCDCKFRYCCAIRCSVCHKNTTVHVCN